MKTTSSSENLKCPNDDGHLQHTYSQCCKAKLLNEWFCCNRLKTLLECLFIYYVLFAWLIMDWADWGRDWNEDSQFADLIFRKIFPPFAVAPGGKTVVLDMLRVVTTYSQHSDCDLLRLLCRLPTSSLIDCNIRSSHLRRSCLDNLNVGWPLVAPLTGITIASSVCPGWPGWDKSKPKNDAVGAKTKKSLNQKFFN